MDHNAKILRPWSLLWIVLLTLRQLQAASGLAQSPGGYFRPTTTDNHSPNVPLLPVGALVVRSRFFPLSCDFWGLRVACDPDAPVVSFARQLQKAFAVHVWEIVLVVLRPLAFARPGKQKPLRNTQREHRRRTWRNIQKHSRPRDDSRITLGVCPPTKSGRATRHPFPPPPREIERSQRPALATGRRRPPRRLRPCRHGFRRHLSSSLCRRLCPGLCCTIQRRGGRTCRRGHRDGRRFFTGGRRGPARWRRARRGYTGGWGSGRT